MHTIDDLTDTLADCRYCSQVSKVNGEDPIGSAPQVDHWLIVEIPQPWPIEMFKENPVISRIFPLIKQLIFRRGVMVRPIAIAPDPDYSIPGFTRIFYYQRPAQQFAQYTKTEYLVPDEQAPNVAMGLLNRLLGKPNPVDSFNAYQQDTQQIRELLVCTHTQVDLACGRFGTPIYRELRKRYSQPTLRVWQSTHFGGHKFAPTLIDLPNGQFWGHLESAILPQLIYHNGNHHQLSQFYRGWAGVNQFDQMAEREAWQQEGWPWFDYPRTAKTTGKGLRGIKQFLYPFLRIIPIKLLQLWLENWTNEATWVNMTVNYEAPDNKGIYKIKVKDSGDIISANRSTTTADQPIELEPAKQYQVTHSTKITL